MTVYSPAAEHGSSPGGPTATTPTRGRSACSTRVPADCSTLAESAARQPLWRSASEQYGSRTSPTTRHPHPARRLMSTPALRVIGSSIAPARSVPGRLRRFHGIRHDHKAHVALPDQQFAFAGVEDPRRFVECRPWEHAAATSGHTWIRKAHRKLHAKNWATFHAIRPGAGGAEQRQHRRVVHPRLAGARHGHRAFLSAPVGRSGAVAQTWQYHTVQLRLSKSPRSGSLPSRPAAFGHHGCVAGARATVSTSTR